MATSVCDLELATSDSERRRTYGMVYTTPQLARFVLNALLEEDKTIDDLLLDPACGGGVFLIESLKVLAASFEADGRDPKGDACIDFLIEARRLLWGVDIDRDAVLETRRALTNEVRSITSENVPTDFFDFNIFEGDYLIDPVQEWLPSRPKFIVGNPPYVATNSISDELKVRLRQLYASAHGRMDFYTLFMHRSSEILQSGGRWCFITPDKYLSSISAAPLREMLTSAGRVARVLAFSSHKVFADAATVPCVTVWENRSGREPTSVEYVSFARTAGGEAFALSGRTSKVQLGGPVPWSLRRSSSKIDLVESIAAEHKTLAHFSSRVSAGLATGLNSAFVLEGDELQQGIERELLHPVVRGRDIRRYEITRPARKMLIPYTWDSLGVPTLIDLEEYPGASRWLGQFRQSLEQRHCVRNWKKQWWDLHDPVGLPLHRMDKVLVPDFARTNRFALDYGCAVPQNTAYYIVPRNAESPTLCAILNSRPIEYLVKMNAPIVKDGFYRYRRQFLMTLPIPRHGHNEDVAIQTALSQRNYEEVESLVLSLFGIRQTDVAQAIEEANSRVQGDGT